jgi:hypothetical protein
MIQRTFLVLLLAAGFGLAAAPASFADRNAELAFEDGSLLNPYAADATPGLVNVWHNQLGADWVRIQAFWGAVSPDQYGTTPPAGFNVANAFDPQYNWADLDRAINTATAGGLRVMLTVHQCGPRWASTEPANAQACWKPNAALFAQFASAVATRYRNKVNRYLLGNEGNEKVFIAPQTECKRVGRRTLCERTAANLYRNYVNVGVPAIKAADPGSQVIIGELAPIGAIGKTAGNLAPLAFIRQMWCRDDKWRRIRTGACRSFTPPKGDGFGYHPYQVRSRPRQRQSNPNLAKLGDLKRLFAVLDRASRRRFNLYITEYGYETNPPDGKNGVSVTQQNRYLQESAYVVWATKRVKLFSQYLWRDDNELNGFQTGLLNNDFSPKPSLASFPNPFFIDLAKGRRKAVIWGQVRPDGVGSVRVLQQRGGAAFTPFLTLALDRLGYFSARRSLPRNSNYRFEYQRGGQTISSDTVHVS